MNRASRRNVFGLVGMVTLAGLVSACASTGAVPRPFPTPGRPAASHGAPPPDTPPDTAAPSSAPSAPALPDAPATANSPSTPGSLGTRGSYGSHPTSGLDGYALAGTALSLRGTPYRNGGTDPSGFDCSGFTQFVFSQHGIALPREVRSQYRIGTAIPPEDLSPGDLVFFATTEPDVSHVAIAIGGDEFVHAPSSTGVVRVEHLSGRYWSERFVGVRRVN